jgi:hypothetical protein
VWWSSVCLSSSLLLQQVLYTPPRGRVNKLHAAYTTCVMLESHPMWDLVMATSVIGPYTVGALAATRQSNASQRRLELFCIPERRYSRRLSENVIYAD